MCFQLHDYDVVWSVACKCRYTRCDLYHTILLYYYAEIKEMILQISEFERGCVQLIASCGQGHFVRN